MRSNWSKPFEVLRQKWSELPAGFVRLDTRQLLELNDHQLIEMWTETRSKSVSGENFSVRGWYHLMYAPILKGKKVLDVGSGLGMDAITFAQSGAEVTCLDIVDTNLKIIRRISEILQVNNLTFLYLEDLSSLSKLESNFDVIWCQGSLICVPFEVARDESSELLKHLKKDGGRWIELAYPRIRWEREGKLPFDKWGMKTDGWAPWIEWYDLQKMLQRLEPAKFKVLLDYEYHSSDFIWFDLIRQ